MVGLHLIACGEDPQWPPRSPYEALLSSPSGRKKFKDTVGRRSISPSPRKTVPKELNNSLPTLHLLSGDDEEDEDEETLQLKLQAIQAKLKLKKLQAAKDKTAASSGSREQVDKSPTRSKVRVRSPASSSVQVPISPAKERREAQNQRSPRRVVLGIDKGLRAEHVSLKRAASASSRFDASATYSRHNRLGGQRGEAEKRIGGYSHISKSFSERLAESRLNEQEAKEKALRVSKARTKGFGVKPTSTGEDTGNGSTPAASQKRIKPATRPSNASVTRPQEHPLQIKPDETPTDDGAGGSLEPTLEPYSGVHLSKRQLDHNTLTRALDSKEVYPIPRLLKEIKSPHYEPPNCESDYVVLGVIASKSAPRDHKNQPKSIDSAGDLDDSRPKFMVLRLTDLKWEIDLFLFDTGFSRFWKLQPGTLVGVLNPGIMPPKNRDTGAFSLKLTSSEDTVLEIGRAKDLGFCTAKHSDGAECGSWVDARKTTVCEFHIYLQVEKAKKGRMEVNTMVGGGFGSGGSGRGRGGRGGTWGGSRGGGRGSGNGADGIKREGEYHDRYLHETVWIAPTGVPGRSTASMLDAEDADVNAFARGMSRDELQRRRAKERSKELALAEKLSLQGKGAGSDYMRARTSAAQAAATAGTENGASAPREEHTASSLGLVRSASEVSLGPAANGKRKREVSGVSEPVGWGGASKRALLLSPKNERVDVAASDTKPQGERSPKKRARFLLQEKGIREPGRESLGVVGAGGRTEDDSDDLEIV